MSDKFQLTGLTGGMGAGKSSVAGFLCRRFGAIYLSSDAVVHELLQPGEEYWRIITELDKVFIRPDKTVDKRLIRDALFSDPFLRRQINEKIHPIVRNKLFEKIRNESRTDERSFFLVEVPLLYEAGWEDMFTRLVVVFAAPEKCVARIMMRDQISSSEAEVSISSQWPLIKKALNADHVVDNTGSWADTMLQLLHLGKLLWVENERQY